MQTCNIRLDQRSRKNSSAKSTSVVLFRVSDWRSACIGLFPEEEGLYIRACFHYYGTGHRLPLDDREAALLLYIDVRMYRRIRNQLLRKGKLIQGHDGYSCAGAVLTQMGDRS